MARKSQDVSIYRIADEAGVSVATVSRVLNRRAGVSEDMRYRIDVLLRKYNFKANYPQPRSSRIAVLIPDGYFSTYLREAISGIQEYAAKVGLSVNIIIQSQDGSSALEQVRDQQCAGVIVLLATEPEYYRDLGLSELPVIFLDYAFQVKGAGMIGHDAYNGGCEAMRHLLKLGHKKIGLLRYNYIKSDHLSRLNAYEKMMDEAGIERNPNWIMCGSAEEHYSPRQSIGIILMNHLLDRTPEVTAVLAMDDLIATGAITAIHRRGLSIPGDISIVGFDNYPESSCLFPALTSVDHPISRAGYLAMEAIAKALKAPTSWTLPHTILPTSLVVRESTGPVKNFHK